MINLCLTQHKRKVRLYEKVFLSLNITALLFIVSCATVSDTAKGDDYEEFITSGLIDFTSSQTSLWDTVPDGKRPVIFAATHRLSDRDQETEVCLQKAAEQASKYVAVKVISKLLVKSNNREMGYLEHLDVFWDKELSREIKDDLIILKKSQDREGTYILAEVQSLSINPIQYKPVIKDGAPEWIKTVPDIQGCYTGVGVVRRSMKFSDSVSAADDKALEELAKQISIDILSKRADIEVDKLGTAYIENRLEKTEAIIAGYYILARWRSEDGQYYYSLSICPKSQNL